MERELLMKANGSLLRSMSLPAAIQLADLATDCAKPQSMMKYVA
jgi:hypothetical protein